MVAATTSPERARLELARSEPGPPEPCEQLDPADQDDAARAYWDRLRG